VRQREALLERKAALIVDEKTYAQQLDLLQFQVNEIRAARLQPGEDATLDEEFTRASNAARLIELSHAALDALSENESSVATQGAVVTRLLQELHRLDPSAGSMLEQQEHIAESVRDLAGELSHYADKVEVDPHRLQELETRLNLLQSLKRKYGPTLTEVIAFGEEAATRLAALEGRDAELARLNTELAQLNSQLIKTGKALSERRRKLAPKLAASAAGELDELGFRQSRIEIDIHTEVLALPLPDDQRLRHSGFDSVEFQFAPNPGEPARPLRTIASSGELARVMLALKVVLAATDAIPLLVFDEVDANVGGETAHAVGAKMNQIAQRRQVLCITHLPQVAAPAQHHFVVTKRVTDGRTLTDLSQAEGEARTVELARMLGGGVAAQQHAAEMLRTATSVPVAEKQRPARRPARATTG
jgi:DNA repair protein RecN (Recombination protein N)